MPLSQLIAETLNTTSGQSAGLEPRLATIFQGVLGLITSSAGAPANATRGTLSCNPAGDDNALTFTAVAYGAEGNKVSVAYVNPGRASQALEVDVRGNDITVFLATNGSSVITSTAAQVKAAIEAKAAAAALVTVAINTGDTGVADNGSGVVTALTRAWISGGAGTGIGISVKGGICIDETGGGVYVNTGTQAVPAWTQVTVP